MTWLGAVCLITSLSTAHGASSESQKAAKAIWRHSKRWKLTAKKPGGSKGEKLKIRMTLTGKLKGRVSNFTAELKTVVSGKRCTLKFRATLGKGSYYFVKSVPVVGGELIVRLTGATCKLPSDFKEKFKVPQMPLKMFLVKTRLCPGLGSRPMTQKNCFSKGR
jgi:hypothetical protein